MASTEDKATSKENTSSWGDYFYNPRTGEVLGRTASSWGKEIHTLIWTCSSAPPYLYR